MVKSPIMIMHGEKDDVVPFSMGKNYLKKPIVQNIHILLQPTII